MQKAQEENREPLVIVANGAFPSSPGIREKMKQAGKLVCCDGAADKLLQAGLMPDLVIGDLDSLSGDTRQRLKDRLIMINDQDSNDLTKAVRHCATLGYKSAEILGATGLREDHTLGNISLMLTNLPLMKVTLVSDYGTFFPAYSGEDIPARPGEQISLFSPDNRLKVTASGLRYPLQNLQLTHWYTASLNEATGSSFRLNFDAPHPLIAYRAHFP